MAVLGYLTSQYARASDTFIRNEVRELRRRGHEVHTYSIRRPDADQVVGDEVQSEYDNTTYILPDHKLALLVASVKRSLSSPMGMWRAFRLSLAVGAPGLRSRLWHVFYLMEAAFLADRWLRDGVQHVHNHLGESPATVAMLASEMSGVPYSLAIHGPYIFRAPEAWALGEKIVRSAFTACITDFTRSQCMIYTPHAAWSRLAIVRCAPEPRFLEGDAPPLPPDKRLVWVGRICEEKGVPLLVEAARRLADEGLDFELCMVGDGPLRASIERSLEGHAARQRIRFTGWASSDAVREHITASRAMVLPSFAEGLPVVLMEALALGRPVISTYIAGIPELVENGACGWIVPAGSIEELARAMRAAIEADEAELTRLGSEGRRRIQSRHAIEGQVGELERLMLRSIESGKS